MNRGKASHEQDGGIMSSSSDIEKLFDHFGGDANAYQEIGRENDARTARTRWPLLVTLDLTQPTIPEIGQRREARPHQPVVTAAAVDRQDTTPKDVASVTRAKAPLFTRSHRRDIPPVAVAAPQPAAPSGASRFGALGSDDDSVVQSAPAAAVNDPVAARPVPSAPVPPVPFVAPFAPAAPLAPVAPAAPVAASAQPAANPFAVPAAHVTPGASAGLFASIAAVPPAASISPVAPFAAAPAAPFSSPFRTSAPVQAAPAAQTLYAAPATPAASLVPSWAQAPAPAQAYAPMQAAPAMAPAAPAAHPAHAAFMQPAQPARQPTPPSSILGKLFAAQPAAAPQHSPAAGASAAQPAPLQSVFDRLRGQSGQPQPQPQPHAQSAAAPAGASHATAPGVPPSWLVNGPRRS
jgi:hypothetical protein